MLESKRICIVSLVLIAMLGVVPCRAEADGEGDEAETGGLKEYVEVNVSNLPGSNTIATKLPTPLQLTPANVGTVGTRLIEEQNAVLLGDALINVSGINAQTESGVHDYFVIRGFNSVDGGLIMTDGASEPEATNYPLYNVASVEVMKGPAGFLYGADPLAGVVNIVRKQPVPTDFLTLGVTAGSFSTTEATVDWNTASDDGSLSFRLNSLWRDSESFRDDKASKHIGVNPGFSWQLSDDSRVNLNFEYVDAEYTPDAGLPLIPVAVGEFQIPDVPRERNYQTPFDFSEQTIGRFQLDYETRLGDKLTLRNKFYYRDLDWQSSGTQFLGAQPVPGGSDFFVVRTVTRLDDRQKWVGDQIEALFSLGEGSVTHNLMAGLEIAQRKDDFDISSMFPFSPFNPTVPGIPAISLFDPVESAVPVPTSPLIFGDSKTQIIAPYVVDQMKFGTRFQLLLGARLDAISRDDDRTIYDYSPFGVAVTGEFISRDDTEVSPMAGVVFAPTTDLSLYANAGQAFAPASPRVRGELDPEESVQIEAGVKKNFLSDNLRTTFAVYQIERENIPIPDANGVTQQAGDQRSRGFEVELAAEPTPRLRTFLSYAYNDAELTSFSQTPLFSGSVVNLSGNTPAFAPKHLLNLWVSRDFRHGLGLAGGARYTDDQFIDPDNQFVIDSVVVFDATVSYEFKDLRLRLNFKNLTDEEYEQRGFGTFSVVPADERSVYFGIDYRL